MSDFLSRLIARSTGAASVPRPVIPPLFGPGPALPEASADAPPLPDAAVKTEIPPASDTAVAPARVGPFATPHVSKPVAVRAAPSPAAPTAPAAGRRVDASDAVQGPLEPPLPPSALPDPRTPVPRPNSEVALPPLPMPASARVSEEPLAPVFGPRPQVTLLLPREAVLPAPGRSAARSPDTSAPGAPVVLVKIGRIEVKAVMPGAPPRPPALPRPAAVSLEDYLQPRRRNR